MKILLSKRASPQHRRVEWNDPKNNKWTMAGLPLYPTEARILAKYVLSVKPNATVAITDVVLRR